MDHEKPEVVSPQFQEFNFDPDYLPDGSGAHHGQNLFIDDEAQVEEKRERRGEKVW